MKIKCGKSIFFSVVISFVLIATLVFFTAISSSATSESSNHFAQTEAKARWEAAENYWSTKVTINNTNVISNGASGELSALTGVTGADAESTYTLKDGVLTLSGSGETVKLVHLTSDASLWIVLKNISIDGQIVPYIGWANRNLKTHDQPLIISSPIDEDFNVLDPSDTVKGGMVTRTGSANNSIRNSGSVIILGDVGFNLGTNNSGSGDVLTVYNGKDSVMILAPGRDSSINSKETAVGNGASYDIQCGGPNANLYISGSIFNDDPVTITVNNTARGYASFNLIDNANLVVEGTYGYVLCSNGGASLTEGSKLVVNTSHTTPLALASGKTLTADADSTVYYKQGDTYTFPVAGNYKVGDSVFTVAAGSKLDSATELSFVRTSDAATVGAVIHTNDSGVKTALVDWPGNGATAILNGAVSYDTDTKTVTLNNVTGNSLHFNIPGDFTVNVTGDENALGGETLSNILQSNLTGKMKLTGTGKITLTGKNSILVSSTGSYEQDGASVVINHTGDHAGSALIAKTNIDIHGGSLKITGRPNGAITTGGGTTKISNDAGKSTYVEVEAFANAVYGSVKFELSGDVYNADTNVGTYLKIKTFTNSSGTGGDHGIRISDVSISGGTIDIDVAKGSSIVAGNNTQPVTITGGHLTLKTGQTNGISVTNDLVISGADTVINIYASANRAINAKTVTISGGTVNTFVMDGSTELRSKYGITATNGNVNISGGTVNAHISENSAICSYNGGNVEISGDAKVDVLARSSGIISRVGAVKISGTADVDVTVAGALAIVAGDVNAIEISGGTVDVNGAPGKSNGVVQATTYTQTGGTLTTTAIDGSEGDALRATNITIDQTAVLNAYALDTDSTTNHVIFAATDMTVNGGEVVAISKNQRAISSDAGNFTLNGGKVSTYGNVNGTDMKSKYGICVQNIKVTDGSTDIKVEQNGAFTGWNSVLIEGGTVKSESASGSIHSEKSLKITGGNVTAEATVSGNTVTCKDLIEISGGTVNVVSAKGIAINSSNTLEVSGGVVTATSQGSSLNASAGITVKGSAKINLYSTKERAMNAPTVEITGGEVSTYLVDDEGNPTKYSKYGITTTTGALKISGGTVNAEVTANSALCAYSSGNIEISGGVVTAKAPGTVVVVNKGDLKISDSANVTVEAKSGAYGISLGAAIKEKDPETGNNVTVGYQPGNVIVSGGNLTVSALNSGRAIQINNGDLTVSGGTVNAAVKNDIAVEATNVTVEGGVLETTAGIYTLNAKETLTVSGGALTSYAPNGRSINGKNLIVSGGNVTASAVNGDAINGTTSVKISGGTVNACAPEVDCHAIFSKGTLLISGGDIRTYSVDDNGEKILSYFGIVSSTENLKITGGTIDAEVAGTTSIGSQMASIEISGGNITAKAPANLMVAEFGDVTISGGNLVFTSNGSLILFGETLTFSGGNADLTTLSETSEIPFGNRRSDSAVVILITPDAKLKISSQKPMVTTTFTVQDDGVTYLNDVRLGDSDATYIETMVVSNIVQKGEDLYYLVGTKPTEMGLFKHTDGKYYVAQYDGKIIIGKYYVWKIHESAKDTYTTGWYEFDEIGAMIPSKNGIIDGYYYENGKKVDKGLFEYDGNYYVSQYDGSLVTGKYYIWKVQEGLENLNNSWRYFAEDGKMLQGIHVHPDKGGLYYFVNGVVKEMGLFKYSDGNYYISQWDGKIITSENYTKYGAGKYYVWKKDASASDIKDGWYYFGQDGAMLQGICEHPTKGGLYYFVNGQVKEMGLFKYSDGNYYISQWDGKIITSENYTQYGPGKYYVWKKHDSASDIKDGWYFFGQDGAMLQGIHMHPEKNDWFYFENGKSKEIGLFKSSDGNYYYAQAGGKLVTSENYTQYGAGKYYAWKIHESANDMKAGWYFFDETGKMIIG